MTQDITYDAGAGNDSLFGGSRRDVLIGGDGDDDLQGGGNADILIPGAGVDTVDAGAGNDRIEVFGSEILDDVLIGGANFDQLISLDGNQDLVVREFDSATNGIERIDASEPRSSVPTMPTCSISLTPSCAMFPASPP